MSVVWPPYVPSGGGGGGGGVESVNGDVGPAVVLDAADVGAATPAQVTSAVAGKADTASVNVALAAKVDRPANAPGQTGRIVTFDSTGLVQSILPSTTTASVGAAAVRTTLGHLALPASMPTNVNWAASKGYVDQEVTSLDARLDAIEAALPTFVTSDGTVEEIIAKTQAEYDLLTPAATTHYLITPA